MKVIPKKVIVDLKRRAKIEEVIASDVPLVRTKDLLTGPSPFRSSKSSNGETIEVRPALQRFACNRTKLNGDVIRYLRLRHKLGFIQACERLASLIGYDLENADPKQITLELK